MPINQMATEHAVLTADRETKRDFVRGMFSAIAPRYDLLNHLLSFNIDRLWRRRAIAALNWRSAPAATYLDLCAGTLDVAAALAGQPGFLGRVVGADFAEPMLRAGSEKVSRAISPLVADALDLPLASNSTAGAIVAFGIRNVSDLDVSLREVHRVLGGGARFVILEFTTPRNPVMRAVYHLYFHRVLPFIGGIVSGHRTAYRYLPASVAQFPAEEELAARMRAAGFANVHWTSLSFGIAAIHVGQK
ncbi:MAG TPA: class I SAM-dependent methyltransferase [Gemmatimonadaceae bacterium]|jgi:demethylmenaquinone methyltransferase/2-methoxy-6-polyprenyl-1,4-benzoquinol methylase